MELQHALIVAKSILPEARWDEGDKYNLPGLVFDYSKHEEPFALVLDNLDGTYICWDEKAEKLNSLWVNINNMSEKMWIASLKEFKEHIKNGEYNSPFLPGECK